jgi:hypothetical protein
MEPSSASVLITKKASFLKDIRIYLFGGLGFLMDEKTVGRLAPSDLRSIWLLNTPPRDARF